jgi:DnaJ-class molecular chaperone
MTQLEKRYVELYVKARFVPLTNEEMNEVKSIGRKLGVIVCDQCNGVGGKEMPLMMGYGWEWLNCSKCEGLGEINLPENIKNELKKHCE